MDFYKISTRETKSGQEIYPDFLVGRSKDLMVRGHEVYAIWDEAAGLWSTDEYDVQRLVDDDLMAFAAKVADSGINPQVKLMHSSTSGSWAKFKAHLKNLSDSSHQLDESLIFANTEVKKSDYASKRLPYPLEAGDISAWDEIIGTLYSVEERAKIEWAIGAVVAGDSKRIQKFVVLYGAPGTGKGTIIEIILKLFQGYTTTFEARALGSNNNSFAADSFRGNPLVAVEHDGDLSRIEDNTKLNSIVSHEDMSVNEKFKPSYTSRVNAFIFMGTNKPVKISDAKSGIIRRLLDVHPTGVLIPPNHYNTLMSRIDFELGAVAQHCLDVYRRMGKNYYNTYRPTEMMLQTDVFYNFIEATYDIFKHQDGATLAQAYTLYKEFCADSGIDKPKARHHFREELRNYFDEFHDRYEVDGHWVRSYYNKFSASQFKTQAMNEITFSLVMEETTSLLDEVLADMPAQLAKEDGTPAKTWSRVKTKLSDIDTTEVHYVKVPETHIVIDFDLKADDGEKSLERNLAAASAWPATYGELSKSGGGVHLHYDYTGGDPRELNPYYSGGIEVKVYHGGSSLRRRLSRCNAVPIATINSGLPHKEKKVLQTTEVQSEKGLRDLIARNLRKEIHPGTKPSVDFIAKILDDAYKSGMPYDVTDMKAKILAFANNSSNQALASLKIVQKMKFASEVSTAEVSTPAQPSGQMRIKDDRLVFYDVEVYPNLFVICWKFDGAAETVRMINPKPHEVEALFGLKLVGFNNRRYDNHILYGRYMGYDNQELYELSQKIINGNHTAMFGEAYNLSYADIYDFSSKKQGLKKFQIDLGLKHQEMDLPWDQPVPAERINDVVEYCVNDVESTEEVFESRFQDFVARRILSDISGLPINATTQAHTAKIVFGEDARNPHRHFEYTDLSKEFPGYEFKLGVSTYEGEVTGEGGYVYAEPGMYSNVAVLDIASMHPTTIEILNVFGPYTKNYADLKAARIAIKRGEYDSARSMLGGKLAPYLKDPEKAKELSYALKIVINIVYGLTSAKFSNPFRDTRNIDNIVAKRGSLFMIDLKKAVQAKGFTVAHIKTDSIKIPDATPEIIEFVHEFGKKYGYEFEHESTYEKFCLVNDAVYIARDKGTWTATGAQFAHPYVFKELFSHEDLGVEDFFETKSVVQGVMYLDFTGVSPGAELDTESLIHVGRTGQFVPVLTKGGRLWRIKDGKHYAVTGTKDHLWMESSMFRSLGRDVEIDMSYFDNLKTAAYETIDFFGSYADFIK